MGVGAVIAMMSIVEGARRRMEVLIGGLGTDVLYVWPDYRSTRGKGSVPQLTLADAQAVLAEAKDVVRVSPTIQSYTTVKNGNKSVHVEVHGVVPTYTGIRNLSIEKGRMFSDSEVERAERVVVLGSKTAEKLFEKQEPVGKVVKINQTAYRVIGVLKARGGGGVCEQ